MCIEFYLVIFVVWFSAWLVFNHAHTLNPLLRCIDGPKTLTLSISFLLWARWAQVWSFQCRNVFNVFLWAHHEWFEDGWPALKIKIIKMFWQLMVYDSSAVNQIWPNQIYTVLMKSFTKELILFLQNSFKSLPAFHSVSLIVHLTFLSPFCFSLPTTLSAFTPFKSPRKHTWRLGFFSNRNRLLWAVITAGEPRVEEAWC